jgi:hypothetical protein
MTIDRIGLKHFFLLFLTISPTGLSSAHLVREGRFMRRLEVEQGCGACGCGVTYPAHSGGLGSPSGPTTGVCHSCWLDVALVNGGKPSGSAECGALRLCPEERSRGQKSPRWRAGWRCAVAACRRSGGADRENYHHFASSGALPPLMFHEGTPLRQPRACARGIIKARVSESFSNYQNAFMMRVRKAQ